MKRRVLLMVILLFPALTAPVLATRIDLRPITRANDWLVARPAADRLTNRIVIVDVFTFECVNCVRVLPNLKRLYATYSRRELAIVGVHRPEVPSYQGRRAYLLRQTANAAIPWPVAVDTDLRIWNDYGIGAWPTLLVFDRDGKLLTTIVGDGRDAELDAAVKNAMAKPSGARRP